MGRIHGLSRMDKEQMTAIFLRETEADPIPSCCVCNRSYNEREYGWIYRARFEVYTCSNECYTSEQYKQLLTENELL